MVHWERLGTSIGKMYLAILVVSFFFAIIDINRYGLRDVFYLMVASTLLVSFFYLLRSWRFGDLLDHEISTWKMNRGEARRRLVGAMEERGVRPRLMEDRRMAWFLLPPLTIVVARRFWSTSVLVGPSTEGTEEDVKRLEAFVERALA